ncbi:hypothetical protein PsYK624_061030 [Phanerochaete sordida]|uniref:Uncharacterized protein n=1 Tax=Phanerochaete sordida TaxID=48140 RepID=A0A9P3G8X6_9APHY|nr:hypothetical protein PsYK624_061030 [Phanerochaete sordida]
MRPTPCGTGITPAALAALGAAHDAPVRNPGARRAQHPARAAHPRLLPNCFPGRPVQPAPLHPADPAHLAGRTSAAARAAHDTPRPGMPAHSPALATRAAAPARPRVHAPEERPPTRNQVPQARALPHAPRERN